mmetsp:Transcript_65445/g.150019  ORF Transcript_65445/g.150019 Transcript_65445/m.150019 type:complete len:134 (-) Transcript_65445:118-519(-)
MLLQAGANPHAKAFLCRQAPDSEECPRLIHTVCARPGYEDILKALLRFAADVNQRDATGRVPLHDAAQAGLDGTTRILLQHQADPNAVNERGWTAMDASKYWKNKTVTRELKKFGGVSHWERVRDQGTFHYKG